MNNIIVTIDGPAGSGKSTIAKIIAKKFNFTYIDTGAMYRMITLYLLENNIDFDDLKEIEKVLNTVNLDMQGDKFYLNNVDVTTKIREKSGKSIFCFISFAASSSGFITKSIPKDSVIKLIEIGRASCRERV